MESINEFKKLSLDIKRILSDMEKINKLMNLALKSNFDSYTALQKLFDQKYKELCKLERKRAAINESLIHDTQMMKLAAEVVYV